MTESTLIQTTENNNTTGVKMEPPPVSPSPSEQQYSLKWNDFQSSILSSFRHLRDEEDFVDVTLACDTRSFTAHKVVLSACSPYFRKLLKANPCEHPIVILRDVRAEDVESLLRFMYNGEVHIGHEQISDFLKTAQLLQVRGLADVTGPQSRTSNSTVNSTLTTTPAVQEHKPSPKQSHPDLATLQAQSTGEDSNSSDTAASDHGDMDHMDGLNGSMDHQRHSFPGAFLGLQGIPGLLPGPSGMHGADSFVSRRQLEMRVRATDPRPCPKCGKIYRSAHTLRTHLEDKHTVCPGYRCVLCGTVAKSRNSLHSHMSRQHRGISTKDLPVLPMPSPFDPDLASRLLAKAGVKISPAELRARASPTSGTRRSDIKLEFRGTGDESNMNDDMDDPEDLTMGSGHNNNNMSGRYHDSMIGFSHPNTTITRVRHGAVTPKSIDSKESHGASLPPTAATGSSLLDTYLQFITENSFGMGMTQEHAAAAFHAAKIAQLNAMGHNLDKLPSSLLPPHLDLSKVNSQHHNSTDLSRIQSTGSVTIEPANPKVPTSISHNTHDRADIRRDTEPMDLGYDNQQQQQQHNNMNDRDNSSGEEDNYSDDDGEQNT
ncbi:protein abrupt isoform X3 [Bradysia coprophila]|uniref:protein abrupt isoform X3 n=1 Tax=Bradysia coprophila TaxID=38358 RepID=UPI00187DD0FF|nr:protein abrupt isoform X3 [Bradysia coprophila]